MGSFKALINWLIVILAIASKSFADEAIFSVIGSKDLRQGHSYKFSISTTPLKRSLTVDFKLSGTESDGTYKELLILGKNIGSSTLKYYSFDTSSLNPGSYSLLVSAYDPYSKRTYKQEQKLVYKKKTFSAFIQTDKAMYKAGDLVNFRVFAIDSETKPHNVEGGSITITDSGSAKIKSFADVKFVKGKYESSLQLSESPTLGIWKISFAANGDIYEKEIEVQEYVLPLYSVRVDNPVKAAKADGSFQIKVTAEYTFGKSVAGSAVVSIYRRQWVYRRTGRWGGEMVEEIIMHYKRTIEIDSASETIDINILDDLGDFEDTYYIDVEFTEALSKKKALASSSVTIVQYAYEAVFIGDNTFAPNTLYNFKLALRKFDGTSAPAGTAVTVTVVLNKNGHYNYQTYQWESPSSTIVQEYLLDASGMISGQFDPLDYDYVYIQSSSAISQPSFNYVSKQQIAAANFLDVTVETETPTINSPVNIKLATTSPTLRKVYCQIISKGVVKSIKSIYFESQKAALTFTPDFKYAPTTQIIFFFYDSNGMIVSKTITLDFDDKLPSYLDLELSKQTVKPGQNLSLIVSTPVGSIVSLLALDQSSLLLKSGNEFTKSDVFADLNSYNQIGNVNWWNPSDTQQFEYINMFALKTILEYPGRTTTPEPTTSPPFYEYEMMPMPMPMPDEEPMYMEEGQAQQGQEAPQEAPQEDKTTQPTAPVVAPAAPRVRKNFFEVILWKEIEVKKQKKLGKSSSKYKGEANVKFTAPDSITSYVVSGVSMNCEYGLGLPENKPKLKVFLPFFIQAVLPHHMQRAEVLMQDIVIFNYLSQSQTVLVSFKRNDNQFDVLDPAVDGWTVAADKYWQEISSVANKPYGLRIVIRPKVLGFIDIAIEAVGPLAGDSILKPLRVIPEGILKTITQSALLSKQESESTISASVTCLLPPSAVPDTRSASAAVVGDLMGDMINNLENLIQMSYGCGEQNMLNFVPNIVALIYLEATGQITAALRAKAIAYAEDGYQRELTYRRSDGSFSAFGNSDTSGSTWLTAYVIKSFLMARPYIGIDATVIQQGLSYFISKQNGDGSFREDGNVIHKDMQGGSSAGLALTAYVSIVLSEILAEYPQHTAARDNALNFIAANLDVNDKYALAISTYALYLGNHASYAATYQTLLTKATETGDKLWWEKPVVNNQDQNCWWYYTQPRSTDVEQTAYVLELMQLIDLAKSVKIAKYLFTQKNSFGGYGSSQDTVVGLGALAGFSVIFNAASGTIDIHMQPDIGSSIDAQVNPANMLTLQTFDLNAQATHLDISSGPGSVGSAIVSLTCKFYEVTEETSPRFTITHEYIRPCKSYLRARICLSYIARDDDAESNMVLVRTTLPSGYTYDPDTPKSSIVRRLDTKDGDTTVFAYLDSLTSAQSCFNIDAVQTNTVENLQDATIEAFDYYDTTKKAQILYPVPADLIDCKDLPVEEETTKPPPPTTEDYPSYPIDEQVDFQVMEEPMVMELEPMVVE